MLLKKRLYQKKEPKKDAKLILIYCEGEKREKQYFNYFTEISSRIRLTVIPKSAGDDHSPTGLFNKAKAQLIISEDNPNPIYDLSDGDEVWFVVDTDSWGEKIDQLRMSCLENNNWYMVQSNPCFEVWLFYHFSIFEEFDGMELSSNWKKFLNRKIAGGFDSRRHPVFISKAINYSKERLENEGCEVNIGCTEVHLLADSFYPLVRKYLNPPEA